MTPSTTTKHPPLRFNNSPDYDPSIPRYRQPRACQDFRVGMVRRDVSRGFADACRSVGMSQQRIIERLLDSFIKAPEAWVVQMLTTAPPEPKPPQET
jgi:hypothetical protein